MSKKFQAEIELKNNFKESAEDLQNLNEGLNNTAQETEKVAASSEEATSAFDSMTGGSIGKFKGLTATIGGVVKSLFTLRGAIIATGLGALLVLITSITQAFKASEDGQNKFAKLMKIIGTILENVLDLFADLGEKIISAFENPVEAVKKLANAIKENIVNRLVGLLELLPKLGTAISKVFSGDFAEAGKIATNAVAKVTLGVENFTEKVEEATEATAAFIKEQQREARLAGIVADKRAKADKVERKLLVERAKLESTISELKLKSRQEEEVSAEDRKKALVDAQALEDQLLKKEETFLKLRLDAVKLENTLARSNKEALDAEAQAEAALLNVKTRRLDAARSTQRELNRVNKEIERLTKERQKVEESALEFGVQFTKEMTNEEIRLLTEAAKEKFNLQTKEIQERVKRQDEQDKLRLELMDEGFEKELAKLVAESEARLLIAKGDKALELEVEADFIKKKEALEDAARDKKREEDKKALEEERQLKLQGILEGLEIAEKGAAAVQALGDAVFAQKMKDVEKGSKEEEKLARKQFKFNKALQLGGAVIDAGKAITASLAQSPIAIGPVPNPAGIASLAFAATTSAANIAKIAASKFESPASSTQTPNPSGVASGGEPQAPQFNVVGESGINQLASLQQEPVQAFVVSGEVTTAQALDRNRVQNATL